MAIRNKLPAKHGRSERGKRSLFVAQNENRERQHNGCRSGITMSVQQLLKGHDFFISGHLLCSRGMFASSAGTVATTS
jgi:hypothetical protein